MRTPGEHRLERGGLAVVVAVLGVVLVLVGLAVSAQRSTVPTVPAPGAAAPELPAYLVEPAVRLEREPPRPAAARGRPRRLVVPRLGVGARVVPLRLDGATLVPPSDPRTLGWWTGSARPGALRGGSVVTGHTVHSGGGAFDDLETLERGDRVRVRTDRGALRYTVTGVTVYRKASLARAAEQVFSQSTRHRLVLVTCEDWNGVEYLSNAVVFADLVPGQ